MVHKQAWSIKNNRYVWDVSSIPKLNDMGMKEEVKPNFRTPPR
jgi:hypothetical protein